MVKPTRHSFMTYMSGEKIVARLNSVNRAFFYELHLTHTFFKDFV